MISNHRRRIEDKNWIELGILETVTGSSNLLVIIILGLSTGAGRSEKTFFRYRVSVRNTVNASFRKKGAWGRATTQKI